MMKKSTGALGVILAALTVKAREQRLTDTEWAQRAGVRKETLSRLRSRKSCDFTTLQALASVIGARVGVLADSLPATSPDGHFPAKVDRPFEQRLLDLCSSRDLDYQRWRDHGPAFFMAGLAVMVAGVTGFDRPALCRLAEQLHPGSSSAEIFSVWLAQSPVRPSRFLPLLAHQVQRAA